MNLGALSAEVKPSGIAAIVRASRGCLWERIVVAQDGDAEREVDLQYEELYGEGYVTVRARRGENVEHESVVALGVVNALPERTRVALMLWQVAQLQRSIAISCARIDAALAVSRREARPGADDVGSSSFGGAQAQPPPSRALTCGVGEAPPTSVRDPSAAWSVRTRSRARLRGTGGDTRCTR